MNEDAQEIAILNGKETLDTETLNEAYKKRMAMLHSYIEPTIKRRSQTASKKEGKAEPKPEHSNIADDFSIAELAATSKANNSDIIELLKAHIIGDWRNNPMSIITSGRHTVLEWLFNGEKPPENRLYAMFACANLYSLAMAKRKLSTV